MRFFGLLTFLFLLPFFGKSQQLDLPYIKPVASSVESDFWYWDSEKSILFKTVNRSGSQKTEYKFKDKMLRNTFRSDLNGWRLVDNCWKPIIGNPQGNTFCLIDEVIAPEVLDNRKQLEWQIVDNRVQSRWNTGRFSEWEFSEDFPIYLVIPVVLNLID